MDQTIIADPIGKILIQLAVSLPIARPQTKQKLLPLPWRDTVGKMDETARIMPYRRIVKTIRSLINR